jgi:hypothetical protein
MCNEVLGDICNRVRGVNKSAYWFEFFGNEFCESGFPAAVFTDESDDMMAIN